MYGKDITLTFPTFSATLHVMGTPELSKATWEKLALQQLVRQVQEMTSKNLRSTLGTTVHSGRHLDEENHRRLMFSLHNGD